jgi:hypothetical protein
VTTTNHVTVGRHVSETGKSGWRWICHTCPPVRPGPRGVGGRPRGGFHWDDRFVIARPRDHPGPWRACLQAAQAHVQLHRKEPA